MRPYNFKPLLVLYALFLYQVKPKAQIIDRQEARLFASNVLFGGLTTGLGAAINKDSEQKFLPAFWKGFKYGCAGGVLLYTGKKCSNLIYQEDKYVVPAAWGSRLIHNAGASLMENVALHRPAFSHYNLYIGFMRLELDWQDRFRFQPRIMPLSLGGLVFSLIDYKGTLDIKQSLRYGSPYIRTTTKQFGAIAVKGNITVLHRSYYDDAYYRSVTAHENVHILQVHEDLIFNTHLKPTYTQLKSRWGNLGNLSKYIYFDASPIDINSFLFWYASTKTLNCYWTNPYEFEAERMSTNRYLDLAELCK